MLLSRVRNGRSPDKPKPGVERRTLSEVASDLNSGRWDDLDELREPVERLRAALPKTTRLQPEVKIGGRTKR